MDTSKDLDNNAMNRTRRDGEGQGQDKTWIGAWNEMGLEQGWMAWVDEWNELAAEVEVEVVAWQWMVEARLVHRRTVNDGFN